MKKIISAIIACIICITSIIGVGEPKRVSAAMTTKERQNMTPSGLDYEQIDERLDEYIISNKKDCASVSVAVYSGKDTICEKQYGYSDVTEKKEVDQDTVYEWGSVTKILVWVSAMQLYERGKLDLDQDIRKILPKGFLTKLTYDDPITMKNLMNHQGGFQDTTDALITSDDREITDLETALKKTEPIQCYRPGTVTNYSNWGASLAAHVIEIISGEDFITYVHNHIFKPLEMEHTSIAPDHMDTPWVAEKRKQLKCYISEGEELIELENASGYVIVYPAGGAVGTLRDFTTFAKALTRKDGKTSLFENSKTLLQMREATDYFGDSDIPRSCHGLLTQQFAVDVMGHNGNTPGCTTTLLFNPDTELGICVMTNVQSETTFCAKMLSLIFGDFAKNERVTAKVSTEEDISGSYVMSRAYAKGRYSLLQYIIYTTGITKGKTSGKFSASGNPITAYGNHQYQMIQDKTTPYFLYAAKQEDGTKTLQTLGFDMIQTEKSTVAISGIALAVFVGIFIISMIAGIVQVLRLIVRILRKGQRKQKCWLQTTMRIQNIIVGVCTMGLILFPLFTGDFAGGPVILECIILGVSVITTVVQLGILVYQWIHHSFDGRQKVRLAFTATASMYMSVYILYWNLYNFWK